MIDVHGVDFEPVLKVRDLNHVTIYEGADGYRYVQRRTPRVADMLEEKRVELGMRKVDFAKKIGVSTAVYNHWTSYERPITKTKLHFQVLMNAFGCTQDEAKKMLGIEAGKIGLGKGWRN